MDIKDVKGQLSFYKANYPLKKDKIKELEIMTEFVNFIEDDETEFNIKLDKILKDLTRVKKEIKKVGETK